MPAVDVTLRGRDRTRNAFRSVERNLGALTGGIGGLNRAFGGFGLGAVGALTGVGVAALAVNRHFEQTIARLDEIDKASKDAGIDPETLQTWRLFGELAGSSTQQVDTALRRLRRRIGEAQLGGAVAGAFADLDVEVTNADGSLRSLDSIFGDLVTNLGNAENQTTAFASAVRIVDTEGARLITGLLDQGTSVDELRQKIEELNLVHDNETVESMAAVNDQLTLTNTALRVAVERLTAEVIPEWNEFRTVLANITFSLFSLRGGTTELLARGLGAIFGQSTTEAIESTEQSLAEVNRQLESMGSLLDAEDPEEYLDLVNQRAVLEVRLRRLTQQRAEDAEKSNERTKEEIGSAAILSDTKRKTLESELAKAQAQERAVGLTATEAQLLELSLRLKNAETEQERALLREIIASVEARREGLAVLEQTQTVEMAIASLTREIAVASGDDEQILLNRLGITREMLEENEQLRDLFQQLRDLSQETELSLGERIQAQIELMAAQDEFNQQLDAALGIMVTLGQISAEAAENVRRALGGGAGEQEGDDQTRTFGDDLEDATKNAIQRGIGQGFDDFLESGDLSDLGDTLLRTVRDAIIQGAIDALASRIVSSLFGGLGGGGGGGFLSGIFGGSDSSGAGGVSGQAGVSGQQEAGFTQQPVPSFARGRNRFTGGGNSFGDIITNVELSNFEVRTDSDIEAIAQRTADNVRSEIVQSIQSGELEAV